MTRDGMIEKLAKHIAPMMDIWDSEKEIAAAVLDLCGPKPLVWKESTTFKACYSGPYTIQYEHAGGVGVWCAGIDGVIFAEGNSKPAMQAAAQAHADAAHWANTRMGDV